MLDSFEVCTNGCNHKAPDVNADIVLTYDALLKICSTCLGGSLRFTLELDMKGDVFRSWETGNLY